MRVSPGDRIAVDSNKVGSPVRTGEVLEVREGTSGTSYLVRWDDGHESVFRPGPGLRVETPGH